MLSYRRLNYRSRSRPALERGGVNACTFRKSVRRQRNGAAQHRSARRHACLCSEFRGLRIFFKGSESRKNGRNPCTIGKYRRKACERHEKHGSPPAEARMPLSRVSSSGRPGKGGERPRNVGAMVHPHNSFSVWRAGISFLNSAGGAMPLCRITCIREAVFQSGIPHGDLSSDFSFFNFHFTRSGSGRQRCESE